MIAVSIVMLSSLVLLALVVSADAAPTTPPDPAAPAAATTPAPSSSSTSPATSSSSGSALPAPDGKATGLDTVPTAGAQIGAGVGACCVGSCIALPCGFIPFVGGILGNTIAGLVIGTTEVVVGDAVGQKRGALLLPVAASTGALVAGGVAQLVISLAFGLSPIAVDPTNPGAFPAVATGALVASGAISLVSVTTALVAPALIYQFTAVDKQPGDTGGFGMPGITEPADPTGTRGKTPSTSTTAPAAGSSSTTPAAGSEPPASTPPPPTVPY